MRDRLLVQVKTWRQIVYEVDGWWFSSVAAAVLAAAEVESRIQLRNQVVKIRPAIPWLVVAVFVATVNPAMAEAQGLSWLDEPSANKHDSTNLLERYLDHLSERIGHPERPDEALWTIDDGNRRELERQQEKRFTRAAGRAALDLAAEMASENFGFLDDTLEWLKDWSALTLDYGHDKKSKLAAYEADSGNGSAGGDYPGMQLDDAESGLRFKLKLAPSFHHFYPGLRLELKGLELDGIPLCDKGTFTIYADGRMGLGFNHSFNWGYLSFSSRYDLRGSEFNCLFMVTIVF